MFRVRSIALSIAVVIISGCHNTPRMYDWGSYEPSIQRLYDKETPVQLETEVEVLSTELNQSRPERIPPGKAAYVGYLYLLKGDKNVAREFFMMEKKLFPESSTFVTQVVKLSGGQAPRKR